MISRSVDDASFAELAIIMDFCVVGVQKSLSQWPVMVGPWGEWSPQSGPSRKIRTEKGG
jgi:hypothetical protein